MKQIWEKFLKYIYDKNTSFFVDRTKSKISKYYIKGMKDKALTQVYRENKEFFNQVITEDFVGYIPKSVKEPVLKIFSEYAEPFQRWLLWQSHLINKKSLHDKKNLERYDGMMIYLKILYTIADMNKRFETPKQAQPITTDEKVEEVSWLENALSEINQFKTDVKKNKSDSSEADKAEDSEDNGSEDGEN